jgi:hypothetical protein
MRQRDKQVSMPIKIERLCFLSHLVIDPHEDRKIVEGAVRFHSMSGTVKSHKVLEPVL